MSNIQFPPGYVRQLEVMRERFLAWCAGHGDQTAHIQFNFPRSVVVAAPIHEAMRVGLVSVNDAGRELIEYLCETGPDEPTVLMVRVVIEAATKEAE